MCEIGLGDLLGNSLEGGPLSPPDLQMLHKGFTACRNHLQLHLALKFHVWSKVPYIFCGLAHWDEAKARRCAEEGRRSFDETPAQEVHHRVTVTFCVYFRSDLDAFIVGRPLQHTSRGFRLAVARLLCIPIVERSIEAKHAYAKSALQSVHFKGVPVVLSLSCRLPEMRKLFLQRPRLLETFMTCFEKARNHCTVAHWLGITSHPALQSALQEKGGRRRSRYSSALKAVIYRVDGLSSGWSLLDAERDYTKIRSLQGKATENAMQGIMGDPGPARPAACTLESVKKAAMLDHFREIVGVGTMFSLPAGVASVTSLQDRLGKPAGEGLR